MTPAPGVWWLPARDPLTVPALATWQSGVDAWLGRPASYVKSIGRATGQGFGRSG